MTDVALLLTCHNRKVKTLKALKAIEESFALRSARYSYHIYLTDDGCTDGTVEEVLSHYPESTIIYGDGSLFWAEGMRLAWQEALKFKHKAYLLINDDTEVYPFLLDEIEFIQEYSFQHYKQSAMFVGATEDQQLNKPTYSGSLITNKWLNKQKRLYPNGEPQRCEIGNANILYVPSEIVDKIGIIPKGYAHGMADYDITYQASKKNIPVLVSRKFCGHCPYDHEDYYFNFVEKSIADRKKYLYSPKGLDYRSHLFFVKRHFPWRVPLVKLAAFFKVYFPKLYLKSISLRTKR